MDTLKRKIINGVIVSAAVGSAIAAATSDSRFTYHTPPVISSVSISESLNDDYTKTLSVTAENIVRRSDNIVKIMIKDNDDAPLVTDNEWVTAENGVAEFAVNSGDYYIFTADSLGNVGSSGSQSVEINEIVDVTVALDDVYFALEQTRQLSADVFAIGDVDTNVVWTSSDSTVATVDSEGFITGKSVGNAVITATAANGMSDEKEIVVTDLIVAPTLVSQKTTIPAFVYTEEEAHILDDILESRIAAAGYGTRAGVAAAARFLTLEFPYKIPYFFENGRLGNHPGRPRCDGEGRYYHKGLYLSADKYDDLELSVAGPAIWGESLTNYETKYYFVSGRQYPNGLDCSGFVTWCLINGGFDVGDVGAGDSWYENDCCDLGEQVPLTIELMESGRIKAGDLIGQDGHIAIVAGIDDEYIYICESLSPGVKMNKFRLGYDVLRAGLYDYVMLMDDVYKDDGNYTNMIPYIDKTV